MNNVKMCGPEEYRQQLFEKFKTAALFAVMTEVMGRVEDPAEFRETLISTWSKKITEEYRENKKAIIAQVAALPEDPEKPLPHHLTPDGMRDQEQFFDSMVEEMSSDIRAMLNKPKDGGV